MPLFQLLCQLVLVQGLNSPRINQLYLDGHSSVHSGKHGIRHLGVPAWTAQLSKTDLEGDIKAPNTWSMGGSSPQPILSQSCTR